MSRRLRLSLWFAGISATVIVLLLLGVYLAARHEPAFYREVLTTGRPTLEKGSDRMLRKAAALGSVPARPGRWEIRITADEINGWLAVDLPKNHPQALPPTIRDPRVVIHPDEMTIACRFRQNGVDSILSLAIQPYLGQLGNVPGKAGPSVLAVRIIRARAGLLPLPLDRVLGGLSQAAPRHAVRSPVAQLRRRSGGPDLPAHRQQRPSCAGRNPAPGRRGNLPGRRNRTAETVGQT